MQIETLNITRSTVFTHYIFIPSADNPFVGQDFTGYEFQAELRDKPGGTLLATFTVTETPPAGYSSAGWVQLRLDDSVAIPTGYHRGTWSLLAAPTTDNPEMIAAGPANIFSQATTWA